MASTHSSTTPTPRKLLITDLNETLLLRSPRPPEGPVKRIIYPRPFMPSFREYLSHPETRSWLDTMVWSSAKPENVESMVERCFGQTKQHLLGIWARDTLGLDEQSYNLKVQTTKDLTQIWNAFPDHSSASTLLLDDSPRKAHLQPWNHLCVPNYAPERRVRDVALWQRDNDSSATQPTGHGISEEGGYDETLLAVVGILEELRREGDVADWIRSGGLQGPNNAPPSTNDERIVNDRSTPAEGTLWFESGQVLKLWADKGRQVLGLLNIEITADVTAEL